MILRLAISAGLFALGYFFGREIGRGEAVRDALVRARAGDSPPGGEVGEATRGEQG